MVLNRVDWLPSGIGRNCMAKSAAAKTIQVKLVRSPVGYEQSQKDTVRALGLRKMHQTVDHTDCPVVRGMINKVRHLVAVTE